ncbi:hypothetical protein [Rosenbergiella epipactidis]|uniref:hypothetical protein n=1 Tax=Rosenbergiella epipactidis TaxID=1544694 RepID=UPI001F4E2635|nr:hypothetical protein [Rosenbergiella epipactidis]
MNDIKMLQKNRLEIRSILMSYLTDDLIGVATNKMRGITLHYKDKLLHIKVFFDAALTDDEEDGMIEIDNHITHSACPYLYNYRSEVILNIERLGLDFIVVPSENEIIDQEGNLGWFFLRKEYH